MPNRDNRTSLENLQRSPKPDRRGGRAALRIGCGAAGCRVAWVAAAQGGAVFRLVPQRGLIVRRGGGGAATMGAGCP